MIRSIIRRMVYWSALSIYLYKIVNMATGACVRAGKKNGAFISPLINLQ